MKKTINRYHFAAIDSTNSWAKQNTHLFDPTGVSLVTAEKQISGRGRGTNRWVSPAEHNVYASFCFFIPKDFSHLHNVAQLLAVSASRMMESRGFRPKLKWPNDIMLSEKKAGGILCEIQEVQGIYCVVAGIGLNVNMPKESMFEIEQQVTSLFLENGEKTLNVEEVVQDLLRHFCEDLDVFLKEGFAPMLRFYQEHLMHQEMQQMRFRDAKNQWKGNFHSLNADGSLNILLPSGEIKRFTAGEYTNPKERRG